MLADELERRVKPDGLAVVMEASHLCTRWRGVEDDGTLMRNAVMRGAFSADADLRREFLTQLGGGDAWGNALAADRDARCIEPAGGVSG